MIPAIYPAAALWRATREAKCALIVLLDGPVGVLGVLRMGWSVLPSLSAYLFAVPLSETLRSPTGTLRSPTGTLRSQIGTLRSPIGVK